ncbi:hypothetical protein ACOSQ3_021450 [Xanthoceras sorbifolium]
MDCMAFIVSTRKMEKVRLFLVALRLLCGTNEICCCMVWTVLLLQIDGKGLLVLYKSLDAACDKFSSPVIDSSVCRLAHWEAPSTCMFKLNVDAACDKIIGKIGLGMVVR